MKALILFMALLPLQVAASTNRCDEPEEIAKWEQIIKKHNIDHMYVKLYALRIGLCKAIADGKVELDTAIDIFDEERKAFGLLKEDVLI